MSTFDELVQELLEAEGRDALTDDPNDAGGLTKYGISQKAFPSVDIAALTEKKAIDLYKKHYWDKFKLEDFPEEARRDVFFNVVNSGAGGIIGLQKELGVATDGKVGPKTIAALKKYKGDIPTAIKRGQIKRYVDIIKNNDSQREYANGWINRALGAEVFSGRGEDLRSLPLDKMQEVALAKLDELAGSADSHSVGNVTTSQHHRPTPARESSVSLPEGFPEQFMAMLGEVIKASQSRSQEVSEPSTEPEVLKGREAAPFDPELDAFIQGVAKVNVQDEPVLNPELDSFIDRAVRAMGTEETEAPVYAEEPQGGRDDSKDPIYGLF